MAIRGNLSEASLADVLQLLALGRKSGPGDQQANDENGQSHGQEAFGVTNMRPRISMCSAWQNHWQ